MALFRCGSCHAVYEDYYPPDDTCIKCNKASIRIITSQGGITMTAIKPTIKLHTREEDNGIHINSLIMKHNGNSYHLYGGARDTIHVFSQSIALYVLTINKVNGTMELNAYMSPEPSPINSFSLHTVKDIIDIFGANWEQLPALTISMKLINYLC
jgi:hypothetical protein